MPAPKGYVQVYTGDGKGKTTAAFGVALRAAGAGQKVFIGQFAKARPNSELQALSRFEDLVTIRQYGCGRFIRGEPRQEDIDAAHAAIPEIREALSSGEYSVVILDEANIARFADAINQMTDRSQFIVITHSKRTMEYTDVLYGVTMEQPGISKLVAVELRGRKTGELPSRAAVA